MSDQSWKIQAKQNFLNGRSPEKLVPIEVKEWGISVYYWPEMTLAERRAISLAYQSAEQGDMLGGILETLLVRARNEVGQLLFSESERKDLLERYDPKVMSRIVGSMNIVSSSLETAEKNF